ncbi:MAG: leucine-rich repeat protein [Propioniciclava sp.]
MYHHPPSRVWRRILWAATLSAIVALGVLVVPPRAQAETVTETANGLTFVADTTNPVAGATVRDYDLNRAAEVTIPATATVGDQSYLVTAIGPRAFSSSTPVPDLGPGVVNLTQVTFNDPLTTIGDSAFESAALTKLDLPGELATIGNRAFAANWLTDVTIPATVTTIDAQAFANNRELTALRFTGPAPTVTGNFSAADYSPDLMVYFPCEYGEDRVAGGYTPTWNGFKTQSTCEPPTYVINFESNGNVRIPSVAVAEGDQVTRPEDPTQPDQIFDHWYTYEQGNEVVFDFTSPITRNRTLFAAWGTGGEAPPTPPTASVPPSVIPNPTFPPTRTPVPAPTESIPALPIPVETPFPLPTVLPDPVPQTDPIPPGDTTPVASVDPRPAPSDADTVPTPAVNTSPSESAQPIPTSDPEPSPGGSPATTTLPPPTATTDDSAIPVSAETPAPVPTATPAPTPTQTPIFQRWWEARFPDVPFPGLPVTPNPDSTPPTATITTWRATFTIRFSEPVNALTADNVQLSGTAAATITDITCNSATTCTIRANITRSGNLTLTLINVTDTAGNPLAPATAAITIPVQEPSWSPTFWRTWWREWWQQLWSDLPTTTPTAPARPTTDPVPPATPAAVESATPLPGTDPVPPTTAPTEPEADEPMPTSSAPATPITPIDVPSGFPAPLHK